MNGVEIDASIHCIAFEYQCVIYVYVGMYRQNGNFGWMNLHTKHKVIEFHGTLMVMLIFNIYCRAVDN